MKRKRIIAIVTATIIVYMLGYFFLRSGHFIVHSVVRGHDFTYLEHSVRGGDMGMAGGLVGHYAAIFYTPLRSLERAYWYSQHPIGAPLSLADRNRLTQ